MAKYKKINEGIIDTFVGALFTAVGKGSHSRALKSISKKDPKIAKKIKNIQQNRKVLKQMLKDAGVKKLTKADKKAISKGEYFT